MNLNNTARQLETNSSGHVETKFGDAYRHTGNNPPFSAKRREGSEKTFQTAKEAVEHVAAEPTEWQKFQAEKRDGFDGTFAEWKEIQNAEMQFARRLR